MAKTQWFECPNCYDRQKGPGLCWVCALYKKFESGEPIDDPEELLEDIPSMLETIIDLRKQLRAEEP